MKDKKVFKYLEIIGLHNHLVHKRYDVSGRTNENIYKEKWIEPKDEMYFYAIIVNSEVEQTPSRKSHQVN
jgi:hypothetical protein